MTAPCDQPRIADHLTAQNGMHDARSVHLTSRPRPSAPTIAPGFLQQPLHPRKALARRLLRRAGAAPVRFERDGVAIAVGLQRAELPRPVDDAACPSPSTPILPSRRLRRVLAVDVADAPLRDLRVAAGKRHLVAELRVAGIPGDLERLVRNRRQQPRRPRRRSRCCRRIRSRARASGRARRLRPPPRATTSSIAARCGF